LLWEANKKIFSFRRVES